MLPILLGSLCSLAPSCWNLLSIAGLQAIGRFHDQHRLNAHTANKAFFWWWVSLLGTDCRSFWRIGLRAYPHQHHETRVAFWQRWNEESPWETSNIMQHQWANGPQMNYACRTKMETDRESSNRKNQPVILGSHVCSCCGKALHTTRTYYLSDCFMDTVLYNYSAERLSMSNNMQKPSKTLTSWWTAKDNLYEFPFFVTATPKTFWNERHQPPNPHHLLGHLRVHLEASPHASQSSLLLQIPTRHHLVVPLHVLRWNERLSRLHLMGSIWFHAHQMCAKFGLSLKQPAATITLFGFGSWGFPDFWGSTRMTIWLCPVHCWSLS